MLVNSPLRGRVALITGASSGIGRAVAIRLASDGLNLVLWARRMERLQELGGQIENRFSVTVGYESVDVRDRGAVSDMAERLTARCGTPDILVNNAGLAAGMDFVQDADLEDWDCMIDTNVKGLLYVTRAIVPRMVERGSGHVVNIGSIAGRQVYPGGSVYCASKHAVQAVTEGAGIDLLGTGVRVSGVSPGLVETEFSKVRFHGDEERAARVYEGAEALSGDDVADVVSYVVHAPPHMNIADVLVFPHRQASVHHFHRDTA